MTADEEKLARARREAAFPGGAYEGVLSPDQVEALQAEGFQVKEHAGQEGAGRVCRVTLL